MIDTSSIVKLPQLLSLHRCFVGFVFVALLSFKFVFFPRETIEICIATCSARMALQAIEWCYMTTTLK